MTSSPGRVPTRPAARPRSPCCASRTGSAARSTTCVRSGRRCRSRSWPRSSSSTSGSCRCCAPRAPISSCSWPSCTTPRRSPRLVERTLELGLEPLVEAHDERELEAALATRARLIGINNRDLRTLDVDTERADRLRSLVPDDRHRHRRVGRPRPVDRRALARARVRCRAGRRGADAGRRSGRRGPRRSSPPAAGPTTRPTSRGDRSSRSAGSPTPRG